MMTVSASATSSRPYRVSTDTPSGLKCGPGIAAATRCRYQGSTSSDRSSPNTSQATESSNMATLGPITVTTRCAGFIGMILAQDVFPATCPPPAIGGG